MLSQFPLRNHSFGDKLLKHTTSRCPICHAPCPAEVWRRGISPAKVFLTRSCPAHGTASVCLASDARFYWLAKGKERCGCGNGGCDSAEGSSRGTLGRNADPGEAAGQMEKLASCLCLVEIVKSCNLACPVCYAGSAPGTGMHVDAIPIEDLKQRIQGVIDRKGGIEIIQLSGGEPTLHPQFFELLEWLHAHPKIDYVLLNTNGLRLALDDSFAAQLGATFRPGRFQLYLQFDGPQAEAQNELRGGDFRAIRERAISRAQQRNIPITLAMTVTPDNLPFLWKSIEFGLGCPNVRGISFQPMFYSGRHWPANASRSVQKMNLGRSPNKGASLQGSVPEDDPQPERPDLSGNSLETTALDCPDRLNTADIILAAVHQSEGKLRFDDFTPLPCGDPNCATIGYLLRVQGQIRSISDFVDFTQLQGFLANKIRYKLEDLIHCGCESEPLADLLRQFELDASNTFRLFIKPFMDAFTWDDDRIDRCCTHVIRPDGKLDSFCRYYSGFHDSPSSS